MNIADRFSRLNSREQRLLNAGLLFFGVVFVVMLPIGLTALVHARHNDNQALRDAIDSLADGRDEIERAKQERATTLERYARPAPPLAAFLAGVATESDIKIRRVRTNKLSLTERNTPSARPRYGCSRSVCSIFRNSWSGSNKRAIQSAFRG